MSAFNPEDFVRRPAGQAGPLACSTTQTAGEAPVVRSDNAHFAPDSVIWRVHGDVTSMMAGGIAALLLEMLHPLALAGVLRPFGIPRRHARPPAPHRAVHRGARPMAIASCDAAIARVRAIHGGSRHPA